MNVKQKKRLFSCIALICIISFAFTLILYALKQNINLFYTPSQLAKSSIQANQIIRVGGFVKNHSVHFDASGQIVTFIVTDKRKDLTVNYNGVLPSLFREGQGIVVSGKLDSTHTLVANQVLAKHDEKYMPRPIANMLKQGEKV